MKTTDYGQIILDEQDIFEGLYSGKITDLTNINIDNTNTVDRFNQAKSQNVDHFPSLSHFEKTVSSIEDFDKDNQNSWFMPEEYKNMDIEDWIKSQCPPWDPEYTRVQEELALFAQHNMINVLKYLKYLVDTMRSNNIVWGVGRGSSVASYCLYLIGVHKIDSIKYNLDIKEFLK